MNEKELEALERFKKQRPHLYATVCECESTQFVADLFAEFHPKLAEKIHEIDTEHRRKR